MATLADLQTAQTAQQIFATLLGVYQANGFPTQSWQPGGVERTRLMAFATALASISGSYIPAAAGGGFLDYASTNWLRLTATELYNIAYNAAGKTVGNITLTSATGSGPYTFTAGQLIAVFGSSGNRYINTVGGTLGAGPASLAVAFAAEFPGAKYNDANNSGALTLATPLPGVTLTNPAGTYSSVSLVGSGTGSLTLGGSPVSPHQMTIRIDSSGASGVASWSYSLDGAVYVSIGNSATSTNIGGSGINVTLVNGGSGTSFVLGDLFSFAAPGSWVTAQGTDDESNTALAMRCRNRWGSLSPIPTNSLYSLMVTSTPSVGSQVTQLVIVQDTTINNQVNIIVAGPAGVLPPATLAAIQAYVNPRVPITDKPVVTSPSVLSITLAATVTVSASQQATAVGAIQTAMTNYAAAAGINGTFRISALIELVMLVSGVVDVSGMTINGVATNLTLGSSSSFVLPSLQPLVFSYTTT